MKTKFQDNAGNLLDLQVIDSVPLQIGMELTVLSSDGTSQHDFQIERIVMNMVSSEAERLIIVKVLSIQPVETETTNHMGLFDEQDYGESVANSYSEIFDRLSSDLVNVPNYIRVAVTKNYLKHLNSWERATKLTPLNNEEKLVYDNFLSSYEGLSNIMSYVWQALDIIIDDPAKLAVLNVDYSRDVQYTEQGLVTPYPSYLVKLSIIERRLGHYYDLAIDHTHFRYLLDPISTFILVTGVDPQDHSDYFNKQLKTITNTITAHSFSSDLIKSVDQLYVTLLEMLSGLYVYECVLQPSAPFTGYSNIGALIQSVQAVEAPMLFGRKYMFNITHEKLEHMIDLLPQTIMTAKNLGLPTVDGAVSELLVSTLQTLVFDSSLL